MDFEYKLVIAADPEEVFAALTNPFQIEIWSGYPADMKAAGHRCIGAGNHGERGPGGAAPEGHPL